MVSLLVSLDRRIGDITAVITRVDEDHADGATTETHRIRDVLDGVRRGGGP